jgi:hypothetical protein
MVRSAKKKYRVGGFKSDGKLGVDEGLTSAGGYGAVIRYCRTTKGDV